jgi:low affinity Fe/Cu permease
MSIDGAGKSTPRLEQLASWATRWSGSSWAIALAMLTTVAWLATGPFFHFSDTWQLVMNTFTSIVTFLMVFLIQRSQNKDTMAMQIKLNELIAAQRGADNRLINLEDLGEADVRALHERYQQLEAKAESSGRLRASVHAQQASKDTPSAKTETPETSSVSRS